MKLCKRIALSEPLKKFGAKELDGPFPGCEDSYGDDDSYFRCLVEHFIVPYHHQVGTVKMGDPSDPTTVVDPRLRYVVCFGVVYFSGY